MAVASESETGKRADAARAQTARRARRALLALERESSESALVGVAEAADYLGVEKPKLWRLLESARMPEPIATLTCGKVWIREELRRLRADLARQRDAT